MLTDLFIATKNRGKAKEFREMLASIASIDCLADHPDAPEVAEPGVTFRENACIKARAYAVTYRRWTISDDSGLEVDALGCKPGVTSARWAALHDRGNGDAANNALLLEQLRDVPDELRTARFVCVLALADPAGRVVLTTRGTVEGRILREPRGAHGFGYDPLFLFPGLGKSTAECTPDEKHAISHRGQALRDLAGLMRAHALLPE